MVPLAETVLERTLRSTGIHPDVEVVAHVFKFSVVELTPVVHEHVVGGPVEVQDPAVQQGLENGLRFLIWNYFSD